MFMFRSRRSNLSKRLVKAAGGRKRAINHETRRASEDLTYHQDQDLDGLLKRMQEKQLEMLLLAVENRGLDPIDCILLPKDSSEPHVLCCRLWRWPDLKYDGELKRLPVCRSAGDPVYICCNPYHWSRLCQPETPPPPYTRCSVDRLKPEDRAPSEVPLVCRDMFPPGSLTTNGEDSMNSSEWCHLAYWELAQRVGPIFPVEQSAVNVFGKVTIGDGLSLDMLTNKFNSNPPSSVQKTRCKIGLGVTLAREGDRVWVFNRSQNPVFVNSLTLEDPDCPSPTRVPAEHCLCVFDPEKAAHQNYGWESFTHRNTGPVDRNSIRISFVKGWGPRYSRQEIISCPCWLEILLSPCR